jgi:hypothetical protein
VEVVGQDVFVSMMFLIGLDTRYGLRGMISYSVRCHFVLWSSAMPFMLVGLIVKR